MLAMPTDCTDSDEFVDFLGMIHRACGKSVLILDNASCHK